MRIREWWEKYDRAVVFLVVAAALTVAIAYGTGLVTALSLAKEIGWW